MKKQGFTVFTPTYNRGHLLPRIYDCLKRQTIKNFEWVIVDDGSTDNTSEVVEGFIKQSPFPITYHRQENAGKHVAQNKGVSLASYELFLPLDSDDILTDNALEIMWTAWENIPVEQRREFSGVGVHCMKKTGERIGPAYPQDGMISNDLEMKFKYRVGGEKYGCIRTDIMAEFPNQEVKGSYLCENTVWFRIAAKYKKVFLNEAVRVYEIGSDSIQKRSLAQDIKNAESRIVAELIYINEFYAWYSKYNFKSALRLPLAVLKSAFLIDYPIFRKNGAFHQAKPLLAKLMMLAGYLPVRIVQKRKLKKYRKSRNNDC